jgi:hypothetical protein
VPLYNPASSGTPSAGAANFTIPDDSSGSTNGFKYISNGGVVVGRDGSGSLAISMGGDTFLRRTGGGFMTVYDFLQFQAANAQTTVGAAGGASALPATPTKYLKVKDSAGTTLVIPAYAAV